MEAEPKGLASGELTGRAFRSPVRIGRPAGPGVHGLPSRSQVCRIPDDPLEGEGLSIQLRHRERMRPLSPFRRGTPTCKGRLTIQKATRHGVSKSTETSSSYRLLLAPVTVKTSPVERLPS